MHLAPPHNSSIKAPIIETKQGSGISRVLGFIISNVGSALFKVHLIKDL